MKTLLFAALLLTSCSGHKFSAVLPPASAGTYATASIEFAPDFSSAEVSLSVFNGKRLTSASLHCGAVGEDGPPFVLLAGENYLGWDVDGLWVTVTLDDSNVFQDLDVQGFPNQTCAGNLRELSAAMQAGRVYLSVKSVDAPDGLIRGQVFERP